VAVTHAAEAPRYERNEDWSARVGLGAIYTPDYLGSDDHRLWPVPWIDLRYKRCFAHTYEGVGCSVYQAHGIDLGVALDWNFGRDEDENARLTGLGDVDSSLEGHLFAKYHFPPGYVSLDYGYDLTGGHEGFLITPKVGIKRRIRSFGLTIDTVVLGHFASADYMQNFFGISLDQSSTSSYTPFNAEAGWRDAGLGFTLSQELGAGVAVQARFSYLQLLSDAKDSPITRSEDQLTGGVFLIYQFD
jgi:outer membrane protein